MAYSAVDEGPARTVVIPREFVALLPSSVSSSEAKSYEAKNLNLAVGIPLCSVRLASTRCSVKHKTFQSLSTCYMILS